MRLGDEEPTARRDVAGDDPRPRSDVGQPAEHATRGVDDVEFAHRGRAGRSYTFDSMKRASGKPSSSASERAAATAAGDRSTPVTRAPSRAHESVSMPKWHWRWSSERPGHVADHRDLVRPEADAAGAKAVEVVELAGDVDRRPRDPTATGSRRTTLVPSGARSGSAASIAGWPAPSGPTTSLSAATTRTARPALGRPPGRTRRVARSGRGSTASRRAAAARARPRPDRSTGRRSR